MGEGLHVVDERRAAEVADLRGKRRAEPWHGAPAFHRLEHRRLLAGDVGAGADHEPERSPFEEPGVAELVDAL